MRPTNDHALIRSILDRPDVGPDFYNNEGFTDEEIDGPDLIFFHQEDVGLLVANVKGNTLIFHAAIPKENRGKKTIDAINALGKALLKAGYNILTAQEDKLYMRVFARSIGFKFIGTDGDGLRWYKLPNKGVENE